MKPPKCVECRGNDFFWHGHNGLRTGLGLATCNKCKVLHEFRKTPSTKPPARAGKGGRKQ